MGAAVGAVGAGRAADRVGRRPTILLTALVFIAGVLGAAFSPAFCFLVLMRFVIGLAVGSASMTLPLFIGELAPPRYRGALVSLNQLAITSGILVSYLIDYGLSSALSLGGLAYMVKRVPETKDLGLAEIQVQIEGDDSPAALRALGTGQPAGR